MKDGEKGITYQGLFAEYLADAEWIRIIDPYVRTEQQVQNVSELLQINCISGRIFFKIIV
ncbi:MAG: hypothetical protein KME29_09425 [Calothrix sp. FI2-JRJ7]|nr:hypothetical protein [Calothrix sp. FI2-JRJ7]